jgi:hypothetical protein
MLGIDCGIAKSFDRRAFGVNALGSKHKPKHGKWTSQRGSHIEPGHVPMHDKLNNDVGLIVELVSRMTKVEGALPNDVINEEKRETSVSSSRPSVPR